MDTYISPKARGQRINMTTTTAAATAAATATATATTAATTIFDLFRASDVETLRYNTSS